MFYEPQNIWSFHLESGLLCDRIPFLRKSWCWRRLTHSPTIVSYLCQLLCFCGSRCHQWMFFMIIVWLLTITVDDFKIWAITYGTGYLPFTISQFSLFYSCIRMFVLTWCSINLCDVALILSSRISIPLMIDLRKEMQPVYVCGGVGHDLFVGIHF